MTNTATTFDHSRQQEQQQQPKPAPGARKAAIEARHPRHIARELEQLAIGMKAARTHKESVRARVAFIVRTIELGATQHLDELGALLPFAWLSNSLLIQVFDDGDMSHDVIAALVSRVDTDAEFARSVSAEMGVDAVAGWRAAQRQGGLL
jgi:hypothetical protein